MLLSCFHFFQSGKEKVLWFNRVYLALFCSLLHQGSFTVKINEFPIIYIISDVYLQVDLFSSQLFPSDVLVSDIEALSCTPRAKTGLC